MRAFHNDPAIKAKYLARVDKHMKADNLIRGTGWDGFSGCASASATYDNFADVLLEILRNINDQA